MSDVIETGSLRKSGDKRKSRSRVLGKRAKSDRKRPAIDRSKDELELGRFGSRSTEKTEPVELASPEASEVVGAKRRKVTSDEAKAARRRSGTELEIATTRDVSKDAEPNLPLAKKRSRPKTSSNARTSAKKAWIGFAILVALSAILVVLSIAVFLFMPRYEIVGEPLVDNPAFANELEGWQREGVVDWDRATPGSIVLERLDLETNTLMTKDIPLPDGDSLMMLRAQVQGDDVRPGPEFWDQARIYLAQVDADGAVLWGEDHTLFLMDGTTEVRNYSRVYSIPDEIRTARLGIEMKNATGRLTVSKLELFEAKRPTAFLITAGGLLLAWTALIVYAARQTLRGIESVRLRIWLAVTAALAIIAIMMPGDLYADSWQVFAYRFGLEDLDINGIAHGVIFAVLAIIVRLGRPSDSIWLHVAAWLPIAVASEVLQLFTIEREPSLSDLLLDMAGVLFGLALVEASRQIGRTRVA